MEKPNHALLIAHRIAEARRQIRLDEARLQVYLEGDYVLAGVSEFGIFTVFDDQTRIVLDSESSMKVDRAEVHGGITFYFQECPNVPTVAIVYGEITRTRVHGYWPGV